MRRRAAILAAVLLALSLLSGPGPFGRVALALGVPVPALMPEGPWRGLALARAGRFAEAAASFGDADPVSAGIALARARDYAAALEWLDVAWARDIAGAEAAFDLVSAHYAGTALAADSVIALEPPEDGPTADAEVGQGNGRAASTGDTATNGGSIGLPMVVSRDRQGARKIFDDRFIAAGQPWLETLEDVPGAYLRARIAAEIKRREVSE